jgi:hypothetical protein
MTDPNPERQAWFAQAGYSGEPGGNVKLRNNLGEASAGDVWQVLKGLQLLQQEHQSLFVRVGIAAMDDRLPYDNDARLSSSECGQLTTGRSTNRAWRDGRRAIVLALLDVDADAYTAKFAARPLETRPPMSEAA